jgi:glycosyltransferase involved in cell wall biosynthesis
MKKLIIFNLFGGPNTNDLTKTSNSWFLKTYEKEFDEVIHLSLSGKKKTVSNGKTSYIVNATGHQKFDLILSPIKLLLFVLKVNPDQLVTYEQVWLWWMIFPLKLLTKFKVSLIPLTSPEEMYKLTNKSISAIIPIWIEKIFIKLGYISCNTIIAAANTGCFVNILKKSTIINKKLKVLNAVPESIIFPSFLKGFKNLNKAEVIKNGEEKLRLIYVGRLKKIKRIEDLILSFKIVNSKYPNSELKIIGTGPDKKFLETLIKKHSLENNVRLLGFISNGDLPEYLMKSDIFVSPLTGHSLREAALCSLPIVAYNIDWIKGFLTHKLNFYSVEKTSYVLLAAGIIETYEDLELRKTLSANIYKFAIDNWSENAIKPLSLNYA